jgi:hypothetical protein
MPGPQQGRDTGDTNLLCCKTRKIRAVGADNRAPVLQRTGKAMYLPVSSLLALPLLPPPRPIEPNRYSVGIIEED